MRTGRHHDVARRREAAAHRVLEELDGTPGRPAGDDPDLAQEMRALHDVAELLTELPADGWSGIPAPASRPAAPRIGAWAPRLALSPALALAAVLACLLLGFGAGALSTGGTRSGVPASGPSVTLRPLADAPARALATAYMPGPGQMILRVDRLPASAPGTYYELWLMTDARRLAPVTAFRVGPGGGAQLTLRLPDDPRRYVYLDISRQRVGAGTEHSPDSVLRGRIA